MLLRIRINQRCVCVTSVGLVRFVPADPVLCLVSPVFRSTSCVGLSDGAIPRQFGGQDPRDLLGGGDKLSGPKNRGRMTVGLGGLGPWIYPLHPQKSVGLGLRKGP